jgi:hypothetical protein
MCEKEDLNIGLVLQYQVAPKGTIDADALVRHARDCGFRGVSIKDGDDSQADALQDACQKRPAEKLISPDVLAKLIAARLDDMNIYFEVELNQDGSINSESDPAMETLRKWIDRFGHAYYESRADHEIKADEDNVHVFYNAIAKYQRYVFIHIPLENSIELKHVPHVEEAAWIDTRNEVEFDQDGDHLRLKLNRKADSEKFSVYGLRLQLHRPEDDLGKTEY